MYIVHFDEAYFAILWDVMIDFMAGDMLRAEAGPL